MLYYHIRNANQQEYGPLSAAELRKRIGDGQVFSRTLAKEAGTVDWKQLSQFPEFCEALAAAVTNARTGLSTPPVLPIAWSEPNELVVKTSKSWAKASSVLAFGSLVCLMLGFAGTMLQEDEGVFLTIGFLGAFVTGIAAIINAVLAYRDSRAARALGPGCFVLVLILMAAILLPGFVPAKKAAQRNACINNLRQMDGAIEQWVLDNKKKPGDIAPDAELFGPGKYLKEKPTCPVGGIYTYGTAGTRPACSVPNHTY